MNLWSGKLTSSQRRRVGNQLSDLGVSKTVIGLSLGLYLLLGLLFSHQFSSPSTLKRWIWLKTQKCIVQQTNLKPWITK